MIPIPEAIEAYAEAHSSEEDPVLRALAEETRETARLPQMLTGHLEGMVLRLLVRMARAKRVLEIGTYTGYGTLSMAMGLPEDGSVITCDVDPDVTAIAQKYWDRSPHGKKIELRLGPALSTIETLAGPFDFVFIDADKENYIAYWDAVLPKVSPGGVVAVDNVLWGGRVLEPQKASDHAVAAFNRHALADDRVMLAMLTVRDGITIAVRKEN